MIGSPGKFPLQRGVARASVFLVCFALLQGCALEPVGRVLVGVSNLGNMPPQINSFSVDPQRVEIGLSCATSSAGAPTAVTKVRWDVTGKRIRVAFDGNTVHQQSTPEIRDTIRGEIDVTIDASSIGVMRLVASGVRHFIPIFAPFPKVPPAPARV